MNQKVTLRFADHVLTFEVPGAEVAEIRLAFRRRWPYKFIRADGDFHMNFNQVLWMKISPGDDVEAEQGVTGEEICETLFGASPRPSDGGKHGSL